MLTTFNADSHIKSFEEIRDEWLKTLVACPDNVEAAYHVLTCNEKLNLLRIIRGPKEEL